MLACFHIRAVLYALRRSAKIEIRRETRDERREIFNLITGGGGVPLTLATTQPAPHANKLRPSAFTVRFAARLSPCLPLPPLLRGHPATPRPLKTPPISSSSRRRGSPILLSGIFFYKSFPRCEPSLAHRFTLFDCSLGKPTSRSKNTRWVREINAFVGEICFSRFG